MATTVFPTEDGIRAAFDELSSQPAGRLAAHVPVLLGVESALAASQAQTVEVDGVQRDVVPNEIIKQRLDKWFGVPGDELWPYFAPMTLPGGEHSLHWRNNGIISQNTMTAAKGRGWVATAVSVTTGGRGYPLLKLDEWRAAVAGDLVDNDGHNGLDLAALAIWLGRSEGIEAVGSSPTREELVAGALAYLQLPASHPLLTDDPPLLSQTGAYQPQASHFSNQPIEAADLFKLSKALDGGPEESSSEGSDEDGGGDWLRERFEEWMAETGYPTEAAIQQKVAREELAKSLFDKDKLAAGELDVTEFRRFAASVYGSPGPQSHINRFLREEPDTAAGRLAATLHHLVYGSGDVAERLDDVLAGSDWRIPGFGEALAVKSLAVVFPENWIPLFVYSSGSGVGKRDFIRIARLPPLDEEGKSAGQLAVESNDVLRKRVEPLLPDDPWGQLSFLWWLRTWAPSSSVAEELLLPSWWIDEIEQLTEDKPQIIFYGPPGTGKTFVARRLAQTWADPGNVRIVQFHPSYAYEDFIQGYRPVEDEDTEGGPRFKLQPGPLMRLATHAAKTGERCVLIIDEINRGNIAKVFGELYYLLEYRGDEVDMQYGGRFSLPESLIIIGTMNTADRSIALLDAALRRRFHFVPFFPDREPIDGLLRRWLEKNNAKMAWVADLVDTANRLLDDRHLQIGPSHFMRENLDDVWLDRIWTYSILPYIEEHFFDDPDRVDDFKLAKLKAGVKPAGEGDAVADQEAVGAPVGPSAALPAATERGSASSEPLQDVPPEDPAA